MIPPDVYQYDDFRLFIKGCYAAKASAVPGYSFRKFAAEAGFSNPGFINDVIKGRRKLSKDAVEKVIRVFEIPQKETEFFRVLVQYGQSRKEGERERLYQQILFRRSRSSFTRLNPSLVKYYQDHRYPLVRSAIEVKDFRGDYEALSRFLDPPLPVAALKKIVRDLCEWGLVKQEQSGKYTVTDKFVEPPSTLGQLIRQLNREWIGHGRAAIERFGPDKRHISSILLGISRETNKIIKKKIENFREEIFDLIEMDDRPEMLMQLSLQYFPKSHVEEKDD